LARSRWRDISDARAAELVRPAADLAVQSAGGVKRRNPAWLEMPAPDASGTRPHALTQKKRSIMRFILCIVLAVLLPASALAAKGSGAISLSRAQAAAARGDQQAAAAISTTTYRQACLSG